MITVPFLDLRKQYQVIKPEIDAAISDVIGSANFIGGSVVRKFEEAFASYTQAAYCIGVGNGTDAIEIAIEALELPKASDVLVPANSFIATSEAVSRSGYRPVFCSANPRTYLIDLDDAARRLTSNTKAIIVVHLYGQPCEMNAVLSFADKHGLRVIEDCAQAHGAEHRGRRVGGIGDIGTFSFYPGKNLGAYGDAGAVVCQDEVLAKRVRMIANHGRISKYDHEFEGRNSRLDALQAAVLSVKLKYLDGWIATRRSVAETYSHGLAGIDNLLLPEIGEFSRHVYHLYVIRTKARDALQKYLSEQGVETGIHYPTALPRLGAYDGFGQTTASDVLHDEYLSLPIGEHIELEQAQFVVNAVKTFFTNTRI
jgi:dTDP-4-amino-4,6-dideoxygalactose transaminase